MNCLELLGYDLNDEDEMRAAREQNVFEENCLKYILKAVEIIESKFL
ncbi:MAG: hypothetical protein ACOC5A_06300 [Halanaerobiales bacterium]